MKNALILAGIALAGFVVLRLAPLLADLVLALFHDEYEDGDR